jgi:transcriptional regulator with XRE-family HTH domain
MDESVLEKELKTLISKKLKQIRKENGNSLEKMAESFDLDYSVFYNIYTGLYLPRLTTLVRISTAYGVPLDFWIKGSEKISTRDQEKFQKKFIDFDLLQVFHRLEDEAKPVLLRILKGYLQRRGKVKL